jgi:hypothetical protein
VHSYRPSFPLSSDCTPFVFCPLPAPRVAILSFFCIATHPSLSLLVVDTGNILFFSLRLPVLSHCLHSLQCHPPLFLLLSLLWVTNSQRTGLLSDLIVFIPNLNINERTDRVKKETTSPQKNTRILNFVIFNKSFQLFCILHSIQVTVC